MDPGQLAALFAMLEVSCRTARPLSAGTCHAWGHVVRQAVFAPRHSAVPQPERCHFSIAPCAQGVVQHEFLALRRRLEADFAFFSACASGASPSTHLAGSTHLTGVAAGAAGKAADTAAACGTAAAAARRRAFKRLSSIEAHERRFLRDFMQCMHASHFRLLGRDEWDAAAAEVGHA